MNLTVTKKKQTIVTSTDINLLIKFKNLVRTASPIYNTGTSLKKEYSVYISKRKQKDRVDAIVEQLTPRIYRPNEEIV